MSNANLQFFDFQLNDAMIKALPNPTNPPIWPAPPSNQLTFIHGGYAIIDLAAPYTNLGDPIQLALGYQSVPGLNYSSLAYLGFSALLGNIGRYWVPLTYAIDTSNSRSQSALLITEKPLSLYDDDNLGGLDYTGGDPSNTISLRIFYTNAPAIPFT